MPGSIQNTSELSKSKSASSFNYGEYLYARGIKKKEELEKNSQFKLQAIADSELSELTFSPAINKNSSIKSPRNSDKPEQVLLDKARLYQQKLEKLKEHEEGERLKECSFTPKINKNTAQNRENSNKVHEKLYTQAEKLKEKQLKKKEQEYKQLTFKPEIKLTKTTKNAKESKEEIFDRLDSTKKKFEAEQELKRRKQEEIDIDESTGQKLFHPMINSSSEKVIFI